MTKASVQLQHLGKPEFRSDIQGLRAIAVLGVILFHANRDWVPGGFVGVDIFFVISGFLIGGIVQQKKAAGQFSFVDFYVARVKRIAPAYFVMLATVTICAAILFTPSDFKTYWQSAKSAMYFGSNSYFSNFGDYFAPSAYELPLLHTWSLAIEMQFYLLLPALIVFLPPKILKPIILILILVLFAFGVSQVADGNKKAAYFSLLVRIPEFLVGVLLALSLNARSIHSRSAPLLWSRDCLVAVGLALMLFSFFSIHEGESFPGYLIVLPCIGAALVIVGHGGRLTPLLSSSPMVWIGGLSYSLYLWHWPVFAFARYVTEQYEIRLLILALMLLFVWSIAFISLRWIETPFRGVKRFVGEDRRRVIAAVLGVCVPILVAQKVNAAIEEPLPVEDTRYADPTTICHGRVVGECLRGKARIAVAEPVLVLGDSHAAQLNLFFDRIGEQTGRQYRVISASSCVTIPAFDIDRLPDWAQKDCRDAIQFANRFIPQSRQIVLAAKWQYQLKSDLFVQALNKFFSDSQAAGKQVTVLWQVPMLSSNVQRLRRFEALGFHRGIQIDKQSREANQRVAAIAAQYPNVRFLDFSKEDLFLHLPFYQGNLVYSDSSHLNEIGSIQYADLAIGQFH